MDHRRALAALTILAVPFAAFPSQAEQGGRAFLVRHLRLSAADLARVDGSEDCDVQTWLT